MGKYHCVFILQYALKYRVPFVGVNIPHFMNKWVPISKLGPLNNARSCVICEQNYLELSWTIQLCPSLSIYTVARYKNSKALQRNGSWDEEDQ